MFYRKLLTTITWGGGGDNPFISVNLVKDFSKRLGNLRVSLNKQGNIPYVLGTHVLSISFLFITATFRKTRRQNHRPCHGKSWDFLSCIGNSKEKRSINLVIKNPK